MPRLVSPLTPNGAAGVEKENDSSASCALPGSFLADYSGNGHPDGNGMVKESVSGRASLERIGTGAADGPEAADTAPAVGAASGTAGDSTATSAFGNEDAVDPAVAEGDSSIGSNPVTATATATPVKAAAGHSMLRAEALNGDGEVLVDGSNTSLNTPRGLAGAGHEEPKAERSIGAGARDAVGLIAARFKAARAVFSPPKPSGGAKGAGLRTVGRKSESPEGTGAENRAADAPTGGDEEGASADGSPRASSAGSVHDSSSSGLLPTLASPVAPGETGSSSAVAQRAGAGRRGDMDSARKPSGSRRSSRSDMFFECSSEVDHLSATDDNSEPDAEMEIGFPDGGSKRQPQAEALARKKGARDEGEDGVDAASKKGSFGGGSVGAGPSVSSAGGESVSSPSPPPSPSPSPSRPSPSMLGMVGILGGPSAVFPSTFAAVSGSRSRRSSRGAKGSSVAAASAAGVSRERTNSESSRRESAGQEAEVAAKAVENREGGEGLALASCEVEEEGLSPATAPEDSPNVETVESPTSPVASVSKPASNLDGDETESVEPEASAHASGVPDALLASAESVAGLGAVVDAGGETARAPAGRRRNRRRVPEWELQLGAEAYEDDSSLARFSQGEVDAKIRERLAEQTVAFEKQVAELKAAHEAELAALETEHRASGKAGDQVAMAAKDTEALEREISMLSERFGEAAADARLKTEALSEKEALLGAVTAQLMGIQNELAAGRTSHASEMQSLTIELESERKRRLMAENNLQRIEEAYNRLEDDERQKRSAGILKMKRDMQALAQAQFNEANKKHNMVKARLAASEEGAVQLQEKTKRMEEQLEAANGQCDQLRQQVEALEGGHAERVVEASRREKLLQEELAAFRAAAAERKEEVEIMARERDAAKGQELTSQNAMTRLAIRNKEMKAEIDDLSAKAMELEGFCTEALDQLDREKEVNSALRAALGKQPRAA